MKYTILLPAVAALAFLASCNMPTKANQITPVYTSSIAYEALSPERLTIELDDLLRRERQLVTAQGSRREASAVQAFLFGFGQGDGIEASELGVVRGNINAVLKAMAIKGMEEPDLSDRNPEPEKPAPPKGRRIYFGGGEKRGE